jgi:hypothetical protein
MITGRSFEANELLELYATPQFGLSTSVRFGIGSPQQDAVSEAPGMPSTAVNRREAGLAPLGLGRFCSRPVAPAAGSVQDGALLDRSRRRGAMDRDIDRDRDANGIPDWQEDENYIDEAPRGAAVGTGGCLLGLLSLATVAASLTRLARPYLSRISLKSRTLPQ